MIETQYITLNMVPSGVLPVLYCSQYDIGRPLGMVVYNGGEAVNLGDYTVTIEATRTDGAAITAAVTTDGNIGAFETTATMTNKADRYGAQLVLSAFGKRVASLQFVMCVVKAEMDENAESIEEDASLYQQYTETVQMLISAIRADVTALENKTGWYVTPEQFGAVGDGVTDDTAAIQAAIDSMPYGGTVLFSKKTYRFSTITMKLKTRLIGMGIGNTILSQLDGVNANGIVIPPNCCCGELANMTITSIDNTSATKGAGVYVSQVTGDNIATGGRLANWNTYADSAELSANYKYLYVHDLYICKFNDGINLDRCKYAIRVSKIYVYACLRYGVYDNSTDNVFDNMYLESCGSSGLYEIGSNNKWMNIKSIWNNIDDYDWDLEQEPSHTDKAFQYVTDNTAAVYIKGSRNSFVNVEAQDNCGHGFLIWGHGNELTNLLADSNGWKKTYGGVGFLYMYGEMMMTTNAIVDNYAYGTEVNGVDRTNAVYQDFWIKSIKDSKYDIKSNHVLNKYPISCETLNTGIQRGQFTVTLAAQQQAEQTVVFDTPYAGAADYSMVITPICWNQADLISCLIKDKGQSNAPVRVRNNAPTGGGTTSVRIDWIAKGKLLNYYT